MDKEYIDCLKESFKKSDFVDYETALASKEIFLNEIFRAINESENKVDEIDFLFRMITKVEINPENNERDVKYALEISLHKPSSIDELTMFDASLVTYYFNKLANKKPVVRFITGSSAEGRFLKSISEDRMLKDCDRLVKLGQSLLAQKIQSTWALAQKLDTFAKEIL